MAELLEGLEDLLAVLLLRLLLAFGLWPLTLARWRNLFLHFSRCFFPQVVQNGDLQLCCCHAASSGRNGRPQG